MLAGGEDVELLDELLGVGALGQVDEDLNLFGGIVVDVADLELALGVGGEDRLDERLGGGAEGQLGDGEQVLRAHLDAGADLHLSATLAVVVFGEVGDAAGGEVGEEAETFSLKVVDRGAAEVVEIVRQDPGREAHGDALGALEQHERKLGRQCHRFPGTAIVAELPSRGFRVEEHLLGEGREARLDVTGGGGAVASEDVAVVALWFHEPAALAEVDECGADRGVAVGVEAHAGAHDVGDLVETAIVHLPKRVEDAALDGLEAVVDVGDGAVEDDVAGVFEEPAAVALGERGGIFGGGQGGRSCWRCGVGRQGLRFDSQTGLIGREGRFWRHGAAGGRPSRGRRRRDRGAGGVEVELGLIGIFFPFGHGQESAGAALEGRAGLGSRSGSTRRASRASEETAGWREGARR